MPDSIPADLHQFAAQEVAWGRYPSTDDVIADGLRLLRERKFYELRRDIQAGLTQIERGEVIELADDKALADFFEDLKVRGRQRLEEKQARK